MVTTGLSALFEFNQFTGIEHARIVALLTILSFISVIVWVTIGTSIVVRQIAIASLRRSQRHARLLATKGLGKNDG